MRDGHVTAEVLDRFARGDLADDDLFEVLRHLQSCPSCARAGQSRAADDIGALRRELRNAPRQNRYVWAWVAAAVIAIALVSVLLPKQQEPRAPVAPPAVQQPVPPPAPVPAPTYADPEWQRLVAQAGETGALPFPANLDDLRTSRDIVRGAAGTIDRVSPAGVVIDDVRPAFTWPETRGGTHVVFVFDGERELMRSPSLRVSRWAPGRDLPRGRTLTWQVDVTSEDGTLETIPSLPSPPAMFRIVSATEHRDLERARAAHGDDALLLSVLHARSGMRDEALALLRRAAANGSAVAQRILDHETSRQP